MGKLLKHSFGLHGFIIDKINDQYKSGLAGGYLGTAPVLLGQYFQKTGKEQDPQAVYSSITRLKKLDVIEIYHKGGRPAEYFWKIKENKIPVSDLRHAKPRPPWQKPSKDYRIIGLGLIAEIDRLLDEVGRYEPLDDLLDRYRKELDESK